MKKLILIPILIVFLLSCSNKDRIPKDILDQEQMELVMWDIIRADELVNERIRQDSSLNKKTESFKLYEEVFALHKITKEKFQKSLAYYEGRPDKLKPVFDSLSSKEATVTGEKYKPVPVEDTTLSKPGKGL